MAFRCCVRRLVSGAVPSPAAHLWGRAPHPGPVARASWAVGVVPGTAHRPHCVRFCELALPAVGVAQGPPPEGAPCAVAEGVRGLALALPRLPALGAGQRGPLPLLWVRACGRGGPAPSLWCACPAGGCVPRGWWKAVPGGVSFHRCEGHLMSGAFPPPAARLGRQAARARCRCVLGTGAVGMGNPALALQRALLRARVARCGGGGGASPGGVALRRCEGCLRSGAHPPPPAGPQGGLLGSATHLLSARVCGLGGPALSLWLTCPAGGCVPRGWWGAVLWGGWPCTVLRGDWCQALSLSRLPVPGGGPPGPVARVSRARVVWVWGTQHRPHSVRTCELALRAVGLAGGRSRGGCLAPLWGASEVRRSSSPSCSASGRAVGVRYPRAVGAGVRAWGPSPVPLAGTPCGGLRAVGVVGGRSGGGWPSNVVRGVCC